MEQTPRSLLMNCNRPIESIIHGFSKPRSTRDTRHELNIYKERYKARSICHSSPLSLTSSFFFVTFRYAPRANESERDLSSMMGHVKRSRSAEPDRIIDLDFRRNAFNSDFATCAPSRVNASCSERPNNKLLLGNSQI